MKTIKDLQTDIIEEFSVLTDWMDKYEYLIELGKGMPLIDEKDKTEDNLISGCQSRVWLSCREEEGRLRFAADSDAIITKGIISLLIRVYDGQKPEDILAADEGFIDRIGLRENLSPTRANGLVSMVQTIKSYAAQAVAAGAAATPEAAPEVATEAAPESSSEAAPEAVPEAGDQAPAEPSTEKDIEADVVAALRTVYDPEIPVNVYDMGLIYEVQGDADGQVFIKMTLTAPNCPIADEVVENVRAAVADVPGVSDVQVELVFEPEWNTDMMSEEAKLELGLL